MRIVVCNDQTLVRKGLVTLLRSCSEIVGEASSKDEAIAICQKTNPDVLVLSLENELQAVKELAPKHKVLLITEKNSSLFMEAVLRAGAYGFVLQEEDPEELQKAIKSISFGEFYVGSKMRQYIIGSFVEEIKSQNPAEKAGLTDSEQAILALIADGFSTKQIAAKKYISPRTVECHKRNIKSKLNAFSNADLTKSAIQFGLISLTA